MKWASFKKEKGWDGLNNAAINTFNSDVINSFVREIFQNSIDARQDDNNGDKKQLRIEINYKTITHEQFPNYQDLLDIVKAISVEKANVSHEQFFKNAISGLSNKNTIRIFEYKDFNTTGLSGADDEPNSTFNACVLSEGISIKGDETAGGSYGIGKNSIYGFSKIRTVLYSSFDGKENIFQGVAKLASYKKGEDTHDSRIYFGNGDKLSSIRNLDVLPEKVRMLLKREEPGLTQIAVCPIEQENWISEFTKAILRNYWPLISDNKLEVSLKENGNIKQSVSYENLEDLLLKNFEPSIFEPSDALPKGNPYNLYNCYKTNVPKEASVHMLGNVKFYYTELPDKKTNCIAYIRNGMVVHSESIWGFGSIGYCGIVICDSRDGNILLRMMEPPTHDKFDPSRLNEKSSNFSAKDGKKSLEHIRKIIREGLNEILNKYRKKAEEIPWLSELIKSIGGNKGKGKGNRTGDMSDSETINRITTDKKYTLRFNSIGNNQTILSTEGAIVTLGLGGKEDGDKLPPKPVVPPIPSPPVPTPPVPPTPPTPPRPTPPNPNPKPITPRKNKKNRNAVFSSRIFRKDENSDKSVTYQAILNSSEKITNSNLEINQVGDSGNVASFELLSVKNKEGIKLEVQKVYNKDGDLKAYKIINVDIPTVLELTLNEPYKSTFKIQNAKL